MTETLQLVTEWDKTFPKSDKVDHRKVTFHNRYGITLAADLYAPKQAEGKLLRLRCAVLSALSRSRLPACTRRRWQSADFLPSRSIPLTPVRAAERRGMWLRRISIPRISRQR